ncbi:hypothetical protein Gohar_024165, partial [Gossypium harknessii]|nr:hypothetical protein [Gossypium harknessii]
SVKSGYKFALSWSQNLLSLHVAGPWDQFWASSLPPKTKDFCWRCLRNFLPTKKRLIERGVNMSVAYACRGEEESLDHVLLGCSFSKSDSSRQDWVLSIMWSLWYHRNLLCWKGTFSTPYHVVNIATSFLLNWCDAMKGYDLLIVQVTRSSLGVSIDGRSLVWKGKFVKAMSGHIDSSLAPRLAEAVAIKEALSASWIKSWPWNRI